VHPAGAEIVGDLIGGHVPRDDTESHLTKAPDAIGC
jgi:hypothetical protein